MSFSVWINRLLLISLMLISLTVVLVVGKANLQQNSSNSSNTDVDPTAWSPAKVQLQAAKEQEEEFQDFSKSLTKTSPTPKLESNNKQNKQADKLQNSPTPSVNQASVDKPVSTNKQADQLQNIPQYSFKTTKAFKQYTPSYEIALANPSNYGERFTTDINGVPINNQAIIVLHETSDSASSAINTFQTPHTDEKKQVSYHSLITLDGTIIYIVPPDKRAFGAGNSVFDGSNGLESVQTNPGLEPSVNNFAYHVSLETPVEGRNNEPYHIGYTDAQYYSLAWLIAQSSVPDERITTHRAVDRSGTRIDPRSFDFDKFFNLLHSFRQPIS
ncbi:N-acetylmuramoyl-L-alanine amidase [Pelatocladus sp. BLCC-F211]|uniref:N-acetylmuramoyl-L-alanine amidase n=1 Tax=Pelatocladus sp. BLCC-F211 TaxID=3342752 RepID=UPI0035B7CEDB